MKPRDDNRNPGSDKEAGGQKNEGEGNRTAAAEYNKGAHRTAQSGKVERAARDAEKAIEGPEGADLKRAEEKGRLHSKGEDPLLNKKR